jgi:hypothetical protein
LTKRHSNQKEAVATAQELVRNLGGTFVEQLGIDLADGSADAVDKWFLWALLFNHRISANIVFKTHEVGMLSFPHIVDISIVLICCSESLLL